MLIQFAQLPLGARFEFRGHRYEKLALSLAGDEERCGNVFHPDTEVFAANEAGKPNFAEMGSPQSATTRVHLGHNR